MIVPVMFGFVAAIAGSCAVPTARRNTDAISKIDQMGAAAVL
jgi:hypothetical protein